MENSNSSWSEFMLNRLMLGLFMLLLCITPYIVLPWTSELFEMPKMLFVYFVVIVMLITWLSYWPLTGKLPWRRTSLDIPIALWLLAQIISTLFSIHPQTSFWGWYTRFHGGLASSLAYITAYYLLNACMDKDHVKLLIKSVVWFSLPVTIYGILQHFGIDDHLWVQDVKHRVFSTLGQPNWLASFAAIITPLSLAVAMDYATKNKHGTNWLRWIYYPLPALWFITIIYTKSRSGFLAFISADIVFWLGLWMVLAKTQSIWLGQFKRAAVMMHMVFLVLILFFGTPFTPSINEMMSITGSQAIEPENIITTGSPSSDIRKVVWKGAVELGYRFPLWGPGLETFGYTYYWVRPAEHNLLSEWDFLYNKAHNEYLNYWATGGLINVLSYGLYIGLFLILVLLNYSKHINHKFVTRVKLFVNRTISLIFRLSFDDARNDENITDQYYMFALAAAFVSILIANIFGFSVVVTGIYFLLLPGMWLVLENRHQQFNILGLNLITNNLKKLLVILLLTTWVGCGYALMNVYSIFKADLEYSSAENMLYADKLGDAVTLIKQAIHRTPNQARFHDLEAEIYADLAVNSHFQETNQATYYINKTLQSSNQAIMLNPFDINILKNQASVYITLAMVDEDFYKQAISLLEKASRLSPTDPKIYYNMGLLHARLGDRDYGIKLLKRSLELKPDFSDSLYGLALFTYEDAYLEAEEVYDKEKLSQAISYLNILLKYHPTHAEAMRRLEVWQEQFQELK